ncbi:MAG: elongation factor P [Phycisphaerae bacterium]
MSLTDRLHKGMVIRHEGHLYSVLDFNLAQTGKQKATVHVKLRMIRNGHVSDRTLDQLGRIEEVETANRLMQYLYAAGENRVFMDNESYEQHELGEDILNDAADFLIEGETYRFLTVEGQVAGIQLPDVLVMEVTDTAPVEHTGGHTNVQKEATLAGGLVIRVPMFIKNGDRIRVKTESRTYQGKEH